MKARMLLSGLLIIGGVMMTGCQECIDCQYTYEDPETKDTLTYNYDKYCGNSDDVDDFQKRAKQEAREVDGDLNCTSNTTWF